MRRRELLKFGSLALIAGPVTARAQQAAKFWRIGYLGFGTAAASADRVEALRAGLRALGYIEGKNLVIEFRWAETVEQLQEAAAGMTEGVPDATNTSSFRRSSSAATSGSSAALLAKP